MNDATGPGKRGRIIINVQTIRVHNVYVHSVFYFINCVDIIFYCWVICFANLVVNASLLVICVWLMKAITHGVQNRVTIFPFS